MKVSLSCILDSWFCIGSFSIFINAYIHIWSIDLFLYTIIVSSWILRSRATSRSFATKVRWACKEKQKSIYQRLSRTQEIPHFDKVSRGMGNNSSPLGTCMPNGNQLLKVEKYVMCSQICWSRHFTSGLNTTLPFLFFTFHILDDHWLVWLASIRMFLDSIPFSCPFISYCWYWSCFLRKDQGHHNFNFKDGR